MSGIISKKRAVSQIVTPPAGYVTTFIDTDGVMKFKDEAGNVTSQSNTPTTSSLQLVPDVNFTSLNNLQRSPGYYFSYDQQSSKSSDPTYSIVDATEIGNGASIFPEGTKALKIELAAGPAGTNNHRLEYVTRVTAETLAVLKTGGLTMFNISYWAYGPSDNSTGTGIELFNYNDINNQYTYSSTGFDWVNQSGVERWQFFSGTAFDGTFAETTAGGFGINLYAGTSSASAHTLYIAMPSIATCDGALASQIIQTTQSVSDLQSSLLSISQALSYIPKRIKTVSAASDATLDWSKYDEYRVLLTGDVPLTFSGAVDGQACVLKLTQDSTGNHSPTLPSEARFSSNITSYTNTSTAGAADLLTFHYDGSSDTYDVISIIRGLVDTTEQG